MPSFRKYVRYMPDLAGILFFIAGVAGTADGRFPFCFLMAWVLIGLPIFARLLRNIEQGRFLDEYFLITIATGGAVAIGRYPEAVLVILLYRLGDHLLSRAVDRTHAAIRSLIDRRPDRPDENGDDPTKVEPESTPADRAQSLALVTRAAARKARSERFITRFARWYTPVIVFAAVVMTFLPPLLSADITHAQSVYRALTFLAIACPSALLVSIPLGWYAAIGTASQRGILIKGADHLDILSRAGAILFGKTGTLTRGRYTVVEVLPAEGMPKDRFLYYAALAESQAAHPIAAAIRAAYGKPIPYGTASEIAETPGKGVSAQVEGQEILAGTAGFLREQGVPPGPDAVFGTTIHVALSRYYIGRLVVADELREVVVALVAALKKKGIRYLALLSGDNENMVRQTARAAGIAEAYGALSPAAKLEKMEQILSTVRGPVVFMGDGIDDAPLLARADVGISLCAAPGTVAIETADIVLKGGDPTLLTEVLHLARRARAIVGQNLFLALAVKGTLLFLAAVGIASLWEAVFADTIAALTTILNASRLIAGGTAKEEITNSRIVP